MEHILRSTSDRATDWVAKFYCSFLWSNGSSLLVAIRKTIRPTFNADIASSGYVLPCAAGDIIHHETRIIGSLIEARIWKNSEPRPTTATVSVTDTDIASGYIGLRKGWSAGPWFAATDNVVVTDGAGGEDYFYPESSGTTITGNIGTATAAGIAATILAATTIAGNIGQADASGYQATIQSGSNTTITAALGTATAAGYTATVTTSGTGYLITEPLKNNTGTLLASQTGATVFVYNVSTGALVVAKTSQTTDASGVMTISDALITPATQYRVVVVLSGGAEGMAKYTAS